jgi:hypothetical protein
MDWSTFFTIVAQVLIGLAVLVIATGIVLAAIKTIRGEQQPRPPKPSWDGYHDENGEPK